MGKSSLLQVLYITFYWNVATPSVFHAVHGYFHETTAR